MQIVRLYKKAMLNCMLSTRYTLKYKGRNRVKSKRLEKIYYASPNHKKTKNSIKNG